MSNRENRLFQVDCLDKGRFPKLDERGKAACNHEIKIWGFEQFLEDGWDTLSMNDKLLESWIEILIAQKTSGLSPVETEKISRSVRYGAALVYYPLQIQAEESKGEHDMPKVSNEQQGALKLDLGEEGSEGLGSFLADFDNELTTVVNGFLTNPIFARELRIDAGQVYSGVFFTYYVLANRAESLGIEQVFGG